MQEIFHLNLQVPYHVYKILPQMYILSEMKRKEAHASYFFKISFNIILSYTRRFYHFLLQFLSLKQ
jgi:hypothetical protein